MTTISLVKVCQDSTQSSVDRLTAFLRLRGRAKRGDIEAAAFIRGDMIAPNPHNWYNDSNDISDKESTQ